MPLRSPFVLPVSLAFLGGVASGVLALHTRRAWTARARTDAPPAAAPAAEAAPWRLDEHDLRRELPGLCC